MKRNQNGLRIIWIEQPLWQYSKFKMQRHKLTISRKIWEILNRQNWQPENPNNHLRYCWILSETQWEIVHFPTMRIIGKCRKMTKKIHSMASWAKMQIPTLQSEQSQKWYSRACSVSRRRTWSLTNSLNRYGRMQLTSSVTEWRCRRWLTQRFR